MPEPEHRAAGTRPAPVRAGLGVDDIRHIPVRERELRFTRNRAGALLMASALVLIAVAGLLQLTEHDTITPYLPAPLPAMQVAALVPAALCLYLGRRCLKYAAVIVTPLGVEILPFIRPRHTMQWHLWQQISTADRDGKRLTLHLADGTAAVIRMAAMAPASRDMLARAVHARLNSLNNSGYGKA